MRHEEFVLAPELLINAFKRLLAERSCNTVATNIERTVAFQGAV